MLHRSIFLMATLIVCFAFAHTAQAQSKPRQIGTTSGKWTAYVLVENGQKVCYMVSQPVKTQGNYSRRGDIYALITHRPSENTKNVFSYITGYKYKSGSKVTVRVNGKTFDLFTQDDTAWTPDPESDRKLAEAIRAGSTMVVKGTSSRGTLTTDTFSLSGSSDAYRKISKECGV